MQNKKSVIIVVVVIVIVILGIYFFPSNKKEIENVGIVPVVPTVPYDSALTTKYISSVNEWPPKVTLANGTFSCKEGGNEIQTNGTTVQKTINGKTYCVTTASEGAAGSTYTTYMYNTQIGAQIATTSFVLRATGCGNYDEPSRSECMRERTNFDPDTIADGIVVHTK